MKKLFVACIAAAAFYGAPASAAPPPPPALVYSWTGFYVGANAGGTWGNFDPSTSAPFLGLFNTFSSAFASAVSATGASLSTKPSGFTGGFQAGYNWQVSNNAVLGIEGDIGAFDLRGSSTASGFAQGVTFTTTSSASTTWLATVRGRLGLAANNWLFYVTGGAAFTTLKGNFAYSDNATNQEAASLSNAKAGYAVGGGVEAALWQQWSIKAEYLYVGFDRVATTGIVVGAGLGPQPINNSIDLKANIVRVGLNYRFQ